MPRSFPPPRRNPTTPTAPLPRPAMPTAAQYAMITKNLGIAPSHDRPTGRFADELHYRGDIDQMIDALSSPADSAACEHYCLTPSEWHNALSGVLAHAAWRFKATLPISDAVIETLVAMAAPHLRDRLQEILRSRGHKLFEAIDVCLTAEESAVA